MTKREGGAGSKRRTMRQRRVANEKLEGNENNESSALVVAAFLLALLFILFAALVTLFPKTDLGDIQGVVVWSEVSTNPKSAGLSSNIRAELPGGKQVYVFSPHAPPPVPGQLIILQVRRNVIGWHSYSWIVGRSPFLEK